MKMCYLLIILCLLGCASQSGSVRSAESPEYRQTSDQIEAFENEQKALMRLEIAAESCNKSPSQANQQEYAAKKQELVTLRAHNQSRGLEVGPALPGQSSLPQEIAALRKNHDFVSDRIRELTKKRNDIVNAEMGVTPKPSLEIAESKEPVRQQPPAPVDKPAPVMPVDKPAPVMPVDKPAPVTSPAKPVVSVSPDMPTVYQPVPDVVPEPVTTSAQPPAIPVTPPEVPPDQPVNTTPSGQAADKKELANIDSPEVTPEVKKMPVKATTDDNTPPVPKPMPPVTIARPAVKPPVDTPDEEETPPAVGIKQPKYRVLIISNNKYKDRAEKWTPLKTPQANAKALLALLRQRYNVSNERIDYVTDATRKAMEKAFSELHQNVRNGDQVLICYFGHGYYDSDSDESFWVSVDVKDDSERHFLSHRYVHDWITKIGQKTQHILVIAANSFAPTMVIRKNKGSAAASEEQMSARSCQLLATAETEYADQKFHSGQSQFVYLLLQELKRSPIVSASQLAMSMKKQMKTLQFGVWKGSQDRGGEFVFVTDKEEQVEEEE